MQGNIKLNSISNPILRKFFKQKDFVYGPLAFPFCNLATIETFLIYLITQFASFKRVSKAGVLLHSCLACDSTFELKTCTFNFFPI